MIDPDLKKHLEDIDDGVANVAHRIGGNWTAIYRGILGGFGYVIGAFIAILLIGWILNVVGVIPYFKSQVDQWRSALQVGQTKVTPQRTSGQ